MAASRDAIFEVNLTGSFPSVGKVAGLYPSLPRLSTRGKMPYKRVGGIR
jgi:hypothetical protein